MSIAEAERIRRERISGPDQRAGSGQERLGSDTARPLRLRSALPRVAAGSIEALAMISYHIQYHTISLTGEGLNIVDSSTSSGGKPVHTACTLCTLCTLFKTGNTTEKQISGFQSRKGGDGTRTFKLREILRESVKLS